MAYLPKPAAGAKHHRGFAGKINWRLGGSPGLVVMGGNSCSKGCGFKSQHRILDGHFSHYFVVKNVLFVWKHRKVEKETGDGTFFKHSSQSYHLWKYHFHKLPRGNEWLTFNFSKLRKFTSTISVLFNFILSPVAYFINAPFITLVTR